LIEFFIDLHNSHKSNPDFKPIEAESLEQLNAFVENHLYIMEMVFKLIWDIEKDWQIDPINIKAHLINQLPKNLDYPINEYSFLLFGGFNRLDGLLITPDIYQQNLNNLPSSKRLNNVLENKIIDFFISSHMNIEARISPDGH